MTERELDVELPPAFSKTKFVLKSEKYTVSTHVGVESIMETMIIILINFRVEFITHIRVQRGVKGSFANSAKRINGYLIV